MMADARLLPDVRTVLVTGSSGFLGRHLVARLQRAGKTVIQASRSVGINVVRDDLPLQGVEHVFHLAGQTGVPASWQDPLPYFDANTIGTARVLEQCRQNGCGMTFVGAYVYGRPAHLPISELDPVDANNPYALSKLLAEQLCIFYATAYGMKITAIRLFNVYGPGQSADFVVPHIIGQVLDPNCEEIVVMDLAPSRDYLFVSDAIEGIISAATAPPGSIFNLGSGEAHSVEDVIKTTLEAAGIKKPYRDTATRRRNEIDSTVADISRLRDTVGWSPRISLERGLRATVESMQ